ncbi:MAG: hypothetical protein V4589_05530 [Bacteroidota bacterium]
MIREKKLYEEILYSYVCGRCCPFSEITQKNCPLTSSNCWNICFDEVISELVMYRDYLLKNKKGADDTLSRYVSGYDNYYVKNTAYKFHDILDMYYKDNPAAIPTAATNTINNKLPLIESKLEIIESKLKTMEQFQAQILDKLSVFSEMIDNIQTLLEKK